MMIRKAVMGLFLFGLGSYLWMGTSLGSYGRTGFSEARGFFQGQVPIEFEVKRTQKMLEELVPDIHNTKRSIVEEEVKLVRLDREIETIDTNLEQEQVAIVSLRDQLSKGLVSYPIGSRVYSQQQMREELNRRFQSYKRVAANLELKREIRSSREASLRAAREKCGTMIQSKETLKSELALLESEVKMVNAKKAGNRFQIDDSRLSKIRQQIDQLKDRVQVDRMMAEEEGKLFTRIPVEQIAPSNLEAQIDEFFGNGVATTGETSL